MTRYRLVVDARTGESETVPFTSEEEAAADAWEAANQPTSLTRIAKDLIWRRATDEEAAAMDAALKQQPIRIQRIYDGVQLIDQGGELYGALNTAMAALFGADRAAELLEPTE